MIYPDLQSGSLRTHHVLGLDGQMGCKRCCVNARSEIQDEECTGVKAGRGPVN